MKLFQPLLRLLKEQSSTTNEIAQNISQASLGISEVNENIAEGSSLAKGVSGDVGRSHHCSLADSGCQPTGKK